MTKARDIASAIPAPSTVSSAELGYLDGVTSDIQTQIDTKAPSSTAVTLTGTQTLTNKTLTNPVIASVVNNTLTSTTGDMIYASAANTPARLAIGSTDQVLKVTAGVPAWATPASGGGMTLLSTTSLSGSSVSLTSISQDYTNLLIVGSVINTNDVSIKMQYNSDTTSGNYSSYYHNGYGDDSRYLQYNLNAGSIFDTLDSTTGTTKNYWICNIYRYSSAENHQAYSSARSTFPSVTYRSYNVHHAHNGTSAISSIQVIASGGTLSGTIYLYGVK